MYISGKLWNISEIMNVNIDNKIDIIISIILNNNINKIFNYIKYFI